MQVTYNAVRDAVIAALQAVFPGIAVRSAENEATVPGFFVKLHEPVHTQELGSRYFRSHPIVVQYFQDEADAADLYDKAEGLTEALRHIAVAGKTVRGGGMRFETVNDALHFHVQYNFHVWAAKADDPAMAALEVEEGIRT